MIRLLHLRVFESIESIEYLSHDARERKPLQRPEKRFEFLVSVLFARARVFVSEGPRFLWERVPRRVVRNSTAIHKRSIATVSVSVDVAVASKL